MPAPTKPQTVADLREQYRDGRLSVVQYGQLLDELRQYHAQTVREFGHLAPGQMRASDKREWEQHQAEFDAADAALNRLTMDHPELRQVDWSQAVVATGNPPFSSDRSAPRILGREHRMTDWAAAHDAGRPEHSDLSLGALLRGWVTSNWRGAEAEQRVMTEGSSGAGGVLVPTPLSAQVIDRARNMARCFQAGVQTVPMTYSTLKVPRLTGSAQPAWRAENASITETGLTFDSVTFTAKSMAMIIRCSRELIEDGQDVKGVVDHDIARQIATELDRVILRGTGSSNEPTGVRNTSGVTITSLGTNGATPADYDHLVDGVQVLRGGNFEPSAMITSPRSETTLSKLKTTYGEYLEPPAVLADIPRLTTNQVQTNLTVGTSNDCSEVYIGQWDRAWFGMRTQLTFTLAERYADVGQVAFVAWVRGDVQLVQPAAFDVITGVRP